MIYFEPGMWIEEGMRYTDGIKRRPSMIEE